MSTIIIVDDEPRAHKILENYISRIPGLSLAQAFTNAMDALDFLKSHSIDLIFLDITMPQVNGFEFLKKLERPPLVIFTTAHSEYALESYEYNAVDYLKKPFSFERFQQSVNKAMARIHSSRIEPVPSAIELKIAGKLKTIPFDDILFFQSMGNYIKIHTASQSVMLSQITTHDLENGLPDEIFVRIHKSYIINKFKFQKISEDGVTMNGKLLPIGKTFKRYVMNSLKGRSSEN